MATDPEDSPQGLGRNIVDQIISVWFTSVLIGLIVVFVIAYSTF